MWIVFHWEQKKVVRNIKRFWYAVKWKVSGMQNRINSSFAKLGNSSKAWVIFPPREHLAIQQDIFGCHNWEMLLESRRQKVKDATELQTTYTALLPTTERCQQC